MRKKYIEVNTVYMERIRVATVAIGLLGKLVSCVAKTPNMDYMTEFMKRHNALLLEYHSIYSGKINLPNHSCLESDGDVFKSSNTWLVGNYRAYNKGDKAFKTEMDLIDMEARNIGFKVKESIYDELESFRSIIGSYARLGIQKDDKIIHTIEYNGHIIYCSDVKYLPIAKWVELCADKAEKRRKQLLVVPVVVVVVEAMNLAY